METPMKLEEALKKITNQDFLGMYRPGKYNYPIYEECGYCYYDSHKPRQKMNFSNDDIFSNEWYIVPLWIKYIGNEGFRRKTQ